MGGTIYQSTNGTSFSLIATVPSSQRVEIEPHPTTAGTWWIAAGTVTNPCGARSYAADLYTTVNSFTNITVINEPNDQDNGIPATDFTRSAPWYNLIIESDASGNLVVGGVDLFRSTNNGTNWILTALNNITVNALTIRAGNIFAGTDNGVFLSTNSGQNWVVTSLYNKVVFFLLLLVEIICLRELTAVSIYQRITVKAGHRLL